MVAKTGRESRSVGLKRYAWAFALTWSILLGTFLVLDIQGQKRDLLNMTRYEARAAINKDLAYRRWAASHGGVYVPVTETTPPNPYLANDPERDITTPSGRTLTLMNPAYMTRQVHEFGRELYGARGHITSLNPIRPENAPDEWERSALRRFAQGESEVSQKTELDGKPYFRLMRALTVEKSCLKCHSPQGYKEGEVRGGISVSLPLAPHVAIERAHARQMIAGYGLVWGLGLCGLVLGARRLQHRVRERDEAEQALRESEQAVQRKLRSILAPTDDIGALDLSDIIDAEAIQQMMDKFYELTRVPVAIIDLSGKVLVATGWQDICTQFHRVHGETLKNCIECDTELSKDVAPGTFKTYLCKNGLRDCVTPLLVGGQHVGNLFTGQFFFEEDKPDEREFRARAAKYGFNEAQYMAAVRRVPVWDKHTIDVAFAFYAKLAHMISSLSHSNLILAKTLEARKQAEAAREMLEAQLLQAQKMEAVGQLAGGIAHDFNNMLQIVLANVENVQSGLGNDVENKEALDQVHKAAKRSAELTRQLLAFSRQQIIQPTDLDLNDLAQGVLKMVRRVIGEHIELSLKPGGNLGTIHADKGQIEQVLMNLCVNARDAMPTGGSLSIETENVVVDEAFCRKHPWATEGRYASLTVTDTGHGMDKDTCERIFEPFFTTKELGQGTGLGLATVYGIVKQHRGLIHVYSEPGMGTAFKVYLPVVDRPAEEAGSEIEAPVVGGTETILVAEDEEMVRNLVVRVLKAAGYTVVTASDGEEALHVFEESAGAIDMAILDVVMPKLGGREVMSHIRAKQPRIRFLFSSGYSKKAIHTDFVMAEDLNLITKPYQVTELLRAVRKILDAP